MRRIISLFLAVVLIFSVNSMAFATDTVQTEPKLYDEYTISTGVYYSYTLNYDNAEWTAIIFVPNDERDVSFSAVQVNNLSVERQDEENDGIYTLTIEKAQGKGTLDYLRDGFASLNEANEISLESFNADAVQRRDSVQADLFNDARSIYGNEYERVVFRDYSYSGVDVIAVHEDMVLRMNSVGSASFGVGTSLSSAALVLTKYTKISVALSVLSLVVSVAGEIIDAYATVDAYIVEVDFGRWTTVNNGSQEYTITNKIYKHCGLNERNNEVRAYLQEENAELNYYPSSSYYHDYTAQADDAYDLYFGRT